MNPKELEARTKNINVLRKNLNLLNETFREQTQRNRGVKEEKPMSIEINPGDEAPDRELTASEIEALNQFEENDKELEAIALDIANSLGDLKKKADNIGEAI